MLLSLEGHLFDSGLINQILDVIEGQEAGVQFEQVMFPPSALSHSTKSTVLLRVAANDEDRLKKIESKIHALVEVIEKAHGTVVRVDQPVDEETDHPAAATSPAQVTGPTLEKRVLLLGAGLVSKSTVQFLGRSDDVRIIVASDNEEDARDVMAAAEAKGHHVGIDVINDVHHLSELVEDADLVISLLPAPMHSAVAQECILRRTHLVTASYESDEMRKMRDRAVENGVIILNECGLDPGT